MLDDLTELPEGWNILTLKDVSTKIVDGSHAPPPKQESGLPMLSARNIEDGKVVFDDYRLIEEASFKSENARTRIKTGDVLLTIVGAIGRSAIVTDELQPFTLQRSVAVITPIGMTSKFCMYQFLAPEMQAKFLREAKGTAQKGIYLKTLNQLNLVVPPLNEQKRIVAKIEELRSHTQAARNAIAHIPKLLEQFRQSVLAAAFRGDLTAEWRSENPDVEHSWKKMTIGEVIHDLKYGTSQKCEYESSLIPVLRIPNIGDGLIKHSDMKYAALPEKELASLKLIPGDILLIRSNGSVSLVGKSAIITEKERGFAYAGYLIRLRPNSSLINSEYFNFCLSSHDMRLQIEIPAKSTSGVHNINTQEVKRLEINLPEILEQKEIIFKVKSLLTSIDRIEQQYQFIKTELDRLDRSILAKAFKGELVPQDPADEPAIVLLERIRNDRASQIKSIKTKRKKHSV